MPKFLTALLAVLALVPCAQAETAAPQLDIAQTVVKVPLAEGVSMDDAVDSMKLRANAINMKLVAEQPLYKEIEAMGQKSQRIQIFQFCNPLTAKEMVDYDINFAAYLPCRITLVQDQEGKPWLVMMNLDIFIEGAKLPPKLKELAIKVRDDLNNIIHAGANGEL